MRGVVFDGERVVVADDLSVRAPGAGEVTVRVEAAGVCHSDLSLVDGTIPYPTPVVLGHEGAGTVEEVGPGVDTVKPADRVVLTTRDNCGRCPACETGDPTRCRETFAVLSQPFRRGDEALYMFANTSVFAERTVVREAQAVPVGEGAAGHCRRHHQRRGEEPSSTPWCSARDTASNPCSSAQRHCSRHSAS